MNYLKYLDKKHNHPIETLIATKDDRIQWQKEVMPYEKTETAKNWDWVNKLNPKSIPNAYTFAKVAGQEPEFIVLKKDNISVAMMLHVKNFKEKTDTLSTKDTSFIWYVQKAPKEYLLKHNINEKEFDVKISKAIIDAALTSALKNNGKLLLHADPAGKETLVKFYKEEGFTQIEQKQGENISSVRGNDGRYFYMGKEKITEILKANRQEVNQSVKIAHTLSKKELYEKVKAFKESRPEKTQHIQQSKGMER